MKNILRWSNSRACSLRWMTYPSNPFFLHPLRRLTQSPNFPLPKQFPRPKWLLLHPKRYLYAPSVLLRVFLLTKDISSHYPICRRLPFAV